MYLILDCLLINDFPLHTAVDKYAYIPLLLCFIWKFATSSVITAELITFQEVFGLLNWCYLYIQYFC